MNGRSTRAKRAERVSYWKSGSMLKSFFNISLLFLVGIAIGCSEETPNDRTDEVDSASARTLDSDSSPVTTSPIGGTELPTWNSPVPNLFIDLPDGFAVRADIGHRFDVISLYAKDDPGIDDTALLPLGVMQIIIADSSIGTSVPAQKIGTRKRMIGSRPGLWHSYVETSTADLPYYMHVLELPDFFAELGPEKETRDLYLRLFVAGQDSTLVEQLLGAATTIRLTP